VQRLQAELRKKLGEIEAIESKLNNPDFTNKAPAHVVQQQRARLLQAQQAAERLRGLLGSESELR
jgi:valyl-tRNA synthetase